MVWFSKKRKWLEVEAKEVRMTTAPKEFTTPDEPVSEAAEPQENWIWVDGVKCVKKDMTPFYGNMQYEVGVMYEMPKEEVKCCQSGYHFCLTLQDLLMYSTFRVCNGNRYFKVKALVNEQEYNRYGEFEKIPGSYGGSTRRIDKFAAAAIIFTEELTTKEILDTFYSASQNSPLPEKYEYLIIEQSYSNALKQMEIDNLLEDGYSEIFAKQIVVENRYHLAHTIASQEGVSMDMRVWYIYTNGNKLGK